MRQLITAVIATVLTIGNITAAMAQCTKPTSISILNTTCYEVDFRWSGGVNASHFEYSVDLNPVNPVGPFNVVVSSTVNASYNQLAPNTTYYVHVRSICLGGQQSDWIHQQFTTSVCPPPQNIQIRSTDDGAIISWDRPDCAKSFVYGVNENMGTPPAQTDTTLSANIRVDGLEYGKKYYLYVRSICDSFGLQDVYSSWSSVQNFTTDIEELNAQQNVYIYPNPAGNTVQVNMGSHVQSADVKVYGIDGRILLQQTLSHGNNIIGIQKLKPGIYYLLYNDGEQQKSFRLLKN